MYVTCLPNVAVISSLTEEIIGKIDAGKNFLSDWEIRITLFFFDVHEAPIHDIAYLGKMVNPRNAEYLDEPHKIALFLRCEL